MPVRIIKRVNHFREITDAMVACLDDTVRETAAIIRANASQDAPVDTGALQQSMYIATDQGTDWGPRANDAENLRHAGNRPDSPAVIVGPVLPDGPHKATVGSAVAHAIYNELGSVSTPARPFLIPAVQDAAPEFFRKVAACLKETDKDDKKEKDSDQSDQSEAEPSAGALEAGGGAAAMEGGAAAGGGALEGAAALAVIL